MSIAQQIRNALRQIGGPANTSQIAEALEDEVAGGDVSKQLFSMERQGTVTVNRDERPFTYTLVPERAAALDADSAETPTPRATTKRGPGKKVKARLAKKAAAKPRVKPAPAEPAAKPAKRKYTRRAAIPASAPPSTGAEKRLLARVGEGVLLAPDLLRRLCILAINPTDSLTSEDRGVIASCLLLAA